MRLLMDVILMLFVSAVCLGVLFTDWFFRARRDCACGSEMLRSITLCMCCNIVHHVGCWECGPCRVVVQDECKVRSHGPPYLPGIDRDVLDV